MEIHRAALHITPLQAQINRPSIQVYTSFLSAFAYFMLSLHHRPKQSIDTILINTHIYEQQTTHEPSSR